jgi:hypothetical protein
LLLDPDPIRFPNTDPDSGFKINAEMRIYADPDPDADTKHWEILFKNTETKGYFNAKIYHFQASVIIPLPSPPSSNKASLQPF